MQFGLQNDRRREISERAIVRHLPLGFHGLGRFAEQSLIAFAANECEILVAAGLLVDDARQILFGDGELLARSDPFGFEEALLDEFGPAGLDGEVGLREGDFRLLRIAVLRDEITGEAGEHEVFDLALAAGAEVDHFVDVNKMVAARMTCRFAGSFRLVDDG